MPAGRLVIYTPQVEAWPDYERAVGWSALEVTLADADKATLGTMRIEGNTVSDLAERTVTFYDLEITEIHFPSAQSQEAAALEAFVRDTVTQTRQTVPLDIMLSYLEDDVIPTGPAGLSMAPPEIFFSTGDSRLLSLDGAPMLVPVDAEAGTNLKFVVNTNWDLFYDDANTTWYLRDEQRWLAMAGEELNGSWTAVRELPDGFETLPDNENWRDAREAIPATGADLPVPTIYISEGSAELIAIAGEPKFEAIADTGIRYVTNTGADLFLFDETYYYLVSGRWFSTPQLGADWSAVKKLPEKFADIPPDHPRGDVLVAVSGTDEARLAVLEASIPRKAEIRRDYVPDVDVVFNGEPLFEKVPGTDVSRAVNTQFDVLKTGNRYYLCYNAIWYVSSRPDGGWAVADTIPSELYSIPPSSPAYHTTHVHVYDSNDDTVTSGYDSGYFNVYMSYGVPVYGSGWYYSPYWYYPYYYWYPRSYGAAAWYNPNTGNFGRAGAVYGPYGGAGRAAVYNPETGTYGRGRAVWDSNELASQAIAYNPRTGTGVYTQRYANEDGAWRESLVRRDDEWLYSQTERDGNQSTTNFETSRGTTGELNREYNDGQLTGSGDVSRGDQSVSGEMIRTEDGVARKFTGEDGSTGGYARNSEGDLYAGKDGEVYKREDGEWYKHGGDEWQPVEKPSADARNFDLTRDDVQAATRQPVARQEAQAYSDFGQGNAGAVNRGVERTAVDRSAGYARSGDARTNQLDRDYRARQNGYDRYNNRTSRRSMGGAGMRGRRR